VLSCKVEGGKIDRWQRIFATALRSPGGNLTLAVVNDAPTEFPLAVDVRGLPRDLTLHRYSVSEQQRDRPDVRIDPQAEFRIAPSATALKDRLAPMSLTVYSTYRLTDADPGVTADPNP
jgi:hypothetical protein